MARRSRPRFWARWHPFDGAGHLPSSETPEAFNRATLAFLADEALSV
jgi:pimeloyl-ACP methyl ester carboxylesterase